MGLLDDWDDKNQETVDFLMAHPEAGTSRHGPLPPPPPDTPQRRLRSHIAQAIWAACLIALLAGTIISYIRVKALMTGPTHPVTGVVVVERQTGLRMHNTLTVDYVVNGVEYRRDIAVKGDGFGSVHLAPYFYEPGDQVALLVQDGHDGSVRTAQRWSPAVYDWGVVFTGAAFVTAVLVIIRRILRNSGRRDLV